MIDILESLVNTVIALVQFLGRMISSLVSFAQNFPIYIQFVINSLNVMPSILIPFMVLCISVYSVLFIINRR